jgi:DNA-binding beta-propeller fold protein YncE
MNILQKVKTAIKNIPLAALIALVLIAAAIALLLATHSLKPNAVLKILGSHSRGKLTVSAAHPYLSTWGSKGNGRGQFQGPKVLAVDRLGFSYVSDSVNNRIQLFDPEGTFLYEWNDAGAGASLSNVSGIAVDKDGNLYVTSWYSVIRYKASPFSEKKIEFTAKWGELGTEGAGKFNNWANGIALDSSGGVYVADTNNDRIQVFDPSGNFISSFGSRGKGPGQFNVPYDVETDKDDNIFVLDTGNYRVQMFDSKWNFIAAWGSEGDGDGQFRQANALAVDSRGYVYVTDSQKGNVQKFDSQGKFMAKWDGSETGGLKLRKPYGITVCRQEENMIESVYIADYENNRIYRLDRGSPLQSQPPNDIRNTGQARSGSVPAKRAPRGPAILIQGKVVDEDNNPLANALVRFYQGDNLLLKINTDATGTFKTNQLPADTYRINVWKSGYEAVVLEEMVDENNSEFNLIVRKYTLLEEQENQQEDQQENPQENQQEIQKENPQESQQTPQPENIP